jgi:cytochrome c551/c552
VLFALLLFPVGFAGWAVGHYTSLGKPSATVVHTVTVGSTSAGTTTSSGTTTSGGGAGVAAGKAVFQSSGCGSCHTFKAAGSTGTIGPDLDSAPATDAKSDHNTPLPVFVKQSIVNPDAYIAKGYTANIMPKTFGSQLSSAQVNSLVAFILSGTKS